MASNRVVRLMHLLIALLRVELFFVFLGKWVSLFNKFIPIHNQYREKSIRTVIRGGARFHLDISDYMQWFLFIDAKDIAVESALKYVRKDSIVLDVGANVGHFSLKLACSLMKQDITKIKIHAFEPNPWIYSSLLANTALNKKIENYFHFHQFAIGVEDGQSEFIFGRRNSGAGRISERSAKTISVSVCTLDTLNITLFKNESISFIKIDVEGFEPEVFRGGWELIQKHRPVLFFEFSPILYAERGVIAVPILEHLILLRYQLFYESDDKLEPLNEFIALNQVDQTNILALPATE